MSGLPPELAGLLNPGAYPHPVREVSLVETHLSWVLLTGELAYKIKRPVRYPFADMRSQERRAFLCQEEVRLNRRFAPDLYLGTSTIGLEGGALRVDGAGKPVESAVRMMQFNRSEELDRLLEDNRVDPTELRIFGDALAALHAKMPVARETDPWGRPESVSSLLRKNLEECIETVRGLDTDFDPAGARSALDERLEAARDWLTERRIGGHVRECHGDLHAGNIVRVARRLTPFDCIEFEPAFRWIDVADEIAFVIADLQARDRPRHAHAFFSGYLERSGGYSACTHLELYKAHRSLVRAKIAALGAHGGGGDSSALKQCRRYLECATHFFNRRRGALILMCGLSGSGKTWLASQLAPQLGAVHLRSDVERNRHSIDNTGSAADSTGASRYGPEQRRRVYRHLADCARQVVSGGYLVIVDATFQSREDRALFRELASELQSEAALVHCLAPDSILECRIRKRATQGRDPSEANGEVLHQQQRNFEAVEPSEGFRVLHAITTDPATPGSIARALAALRPSADP